MFDFEENMIPNYDTDAYEAAETFFMETIRPIAYKFVREKKEEGWSFNLADDYIANPGMGTVSLGFEMHRKPEYKGIFVSISSEPWSEDIVMKATHEKNLNMPFQAEEPIEQLTPKFIEMYLSNAVHFLMQVPEMPDELELTQFTKEIMDDINQRKGL
ncbi:hypothetical protein [Flaviaesturariibacter amylovorans]|uniref:Uncharacterized protein n=1 Tax=Flaviaesturariibacter amylovorans TaxID=1084520 RepID=A0ABP8GKW5_9BACT